MSLYSTLILAPAGAVPREVPGDVRAAARPHLHHLGRPGGHRQRQQPPQREGQAAAPRQRPRQRQVEGDAVEHQPAGGPLAGTIPSLYQSIVFLIGLSKLFPVPLKHFDFEKYLVAEKKNIFFIILFLIKLQQIFYCSRCLP